MVYTYYKNSYFYITDNQKQMKRVVIFFLLISPSLIAQELKLAKATRQVINQPVSFSSTTNYVILIKKEKSFKWSVDSLVDVYTQKKISYTIIKSDTSVTKSPNHPLISFSKKDKGVFKRRQARNNKQ